MDSCKVLVCLFAAVMILHGAAASETWGYYGDDDSSHWAASEANCGGSSQSPINIVTANAQTATYANFKYTGFDTTTGLSLTMKNNGHTAQMDIAGTVKISGGGLTGEYNVAQLHFHWGKDSSVGSEHQVNGNAYPMEMHVVTWKASYNNITTAVGNPDGLAVLGFFFKIGNNPPSGLQKIVDALPSVAHHDTDDPLTTAFKIEDLAPTNYVQFYRYSGSLTTPKCNQVVTWTLFAETIDVTEAQMTEFRKLHAGEDNADGDDYMYNNYRPVQILGTRKVSFRANSGFRPSINLSLMLLPLLSFALKILC